MTTILKQIESYRNRPKYQDYPIMDWQSIIYAATDYVEDIEVLTEGLHKVFPSSKYPNFKWPNLGKLAEARQDLFRWLDRHPKSFLDANFAAWMMNGVTFKSPLSKPNQLILGPGPLPKLWISMTTIIENLKIIIRQSVDSNSKRFSLNQEQQALISQIVFWGCSFMSQKASWYVPLANQAIKIADSYGMNRNEWFVWYDALVRFVARIQLSCTIAKLDYEKLQLELTPRSRTRKLVMA